MIASTYKVTNVSQNISSNSSPLFTTPFKPRTNVMSFHSSLPTGFDPYHDYANNLLPTTTATDDQYRIAVPPKYSYNFDDPLEDFEQQEPLPTVEMHPASSSATTCAAQSEFCYPTLDDITGLEAL